MSLALFYGTWVRSNIHCVDMAWANLVWSLVPGLFSLHFPLIILHALSLIRPSHLFLFLYCISFYLSCYCLTASGTVKSPLYISLSIHPLRPEDTPSCTTQCALAFSLLWAGLWRKRHKDMLGRLAAGSPPLSLCLLHLNKGKDAIAGEATPAHAFSHCSSWHRCEHMEGKCKASLPWCVFCAYWDETRSTCFVLIEKVMMKMMMMNWPYFFFYFKPWLELYFS